MLLVYKVHGVWKRLFWPPTIQATVFRTSFRQKAIAADDNDPQEKLDNKSCSASSLSGQSTESNFWASHITLAVHCDTAIVAYWLLRTASARREYTVYAYVPVYG